MAMLLLLACQAVDSGGAASGPVMIQLGDAQQLRYEAGVEPARVEVDVAEDVRLDWTGLTTDVYGRPLGEVPVSEAWVFAPSHAEVGVLLHALVNERLEMAALSVFATCIGIAGVCDLRDFRLLDGAADVPERLAESGVAWGLVLVNPADGGVAGVYTLAAGEPGSEVDVELSTTAPVSVSVDWGAPVSGVPAGDPAILVDWSAVTLTGTGAPWNEAAADELFVVHSSLDSAALAGHLLDLPAVADARWAMPIVSNQTTDLSELRGEEPFPGFDATGTWLIGIACVGCSTPAPRLLTLVEVAP